MNSNQIFYNYTTKYNNFSISIEDSIKYLKKILEIFDQMTVPNLDLINYEKIIYIEYNYINNGNEELSYLLKQVKEKISNSFLYKQQLLNRLILKSDKRVKKS